MEPGNFNSSLSAMIWIVQLLVSYDSALEEQQGCGETLKLVKAHCDQYLQQTVETPMGEILRWRLLLFRMSGTSIGTHEASWNEGEQVLTYENTELRMDQIPSLLESEYQGCSQLLYDDFMLGLKSLRRIQPRMLKDGVNVDTVRWNFTQHRDNAHALKGADGALLADIKQSEQLCRVFLVEDSRPSGRLAWRESAMASYEATVQELLKRLRVLIHISGGQPVRESEFFSMTYRNTQRRRSIIVHFDRVMVHVQYHKGQQQTGRQLQRECSLSRQPGRRATSGLHCPCSTAAREVPTTGIAKGVALSVPLGERREGVARGSIESLPGRSVHPSMRTPASRSQLEADHCGYR